MIRRKTYLMFDWGKWDQQIHLAALDFHQQTDMWPNILLANDPTLGRITFMANQRQENLQKEVGDESESKAEPTYKELSGFATLKYNLEFYLDVEMEDELFSLIYDSEPDGDGEPVPKDDNVPSKKTSRRIKKKRNRKKGKAA